MLSTKSFSLYYEKYQKDSIIYFALIQQCFEMADHQHQSLCKVPAVWYTRQEAWRRQTKDGVCKNLLVVFWDNKFWHYRFNTLSPVVMCLRANTSLRENVISVRWLVLQQTKFRNCYEYTMYTQNDQSTKGNCFMSSTYVIRLTIFQKKKIISEKLECDN